MHTVMHSFLKYNFYRSQKMKRLLLYIYYNIKYKDMSSSNMKPSAFGYVIHDFLHF